MDNKKKFFIGLGVISVVYVLVSSLNLSHDSSKDYMTETDHKYSKENVIKMIGNQDGDLQFLLKLSSSIQSFFSFILPAIKLSDISEVTIDSSGVSNDSSVCRIVNEDDLLIIKNGECKLIINVSDKETRQLSFVYRRVKNVESSRAISKVNKNKLLHVNSKVFKPQLMIDTSKTIRPNKLPNTSDLNVGFPLVYSFTRFNGKDVKKEDKVKKEIKENQEEKFSIPGGGAKLILECSVCKNYDLLITQ